MTLLPYTLPIFMTITFGFTQNLPLSTGVATPTCLQTRELSNPAVSNIATALSAAVPEACNPGLETNSTDGNRSIGYYRLDSFSFNISHIVNAPSGANLPSACPDAFNAIIASCVQDAPAAGFWGGWLLQGANNYSISNSNAPANGLTSLAFSVRASSLGLVGTGSLLSRSTVGISDSPPSGLPIYSSPSSLTWFYNWQGATESPSNYGPSSGSSTGTAASSHSIVSSGFVPTLSVSEFGTAPASGIPASISSSSIRVSGIDLSGALAAVSSGAHSGGPATSSNSSSASKLPSSPPLETGQLPTTVRSSRAAATLTSWANSPPAPASTVGNFGPSSTASNPASSPVLATTLASLPSFTLSPSGIQISPSGTTASSQGVIFGGLLFSLSKSIHSVDLTIPTIKAEVIQEVENTIKKATDLFDDLGGTDITGSCNGESKLKRLSNPFTSLDKLAGDITKVIGCADEVLSSLKDNLDKDTPDPDLTDDLLDDLSTLASETDPDDDPTRSASETTASQTASTTSSSSSTASSTSSSFSSSSASDCTSCCPTDIPALPTDGTPAVTAAPTDFDTLDKRIVPERFQRMAKRRPDIPMSKINNCILTTPPNWPVTTPAYPGGYEFWTSDKSGELSKLTSVSRYYRSTTFGAPACTPTITKIDAMQWTFQQSGPNVPENDMVSVDHAYEIGFLKSFMESIIDRPGGVTCSDANAQFFTTGNCPANSLQPIFGSLPSYANPDFVAMSQWLNGAAKGWVLGPSFDPQLGGSLTSSTKVKKSDSWNQAIGKITNKMRLAQILIEAALIIKADNTIAQMQKTNNRIYAAFQTYDTYLSQNPGLPQSRFGWASHYKTYMNNYINYRNGASARLLPGLLANIGNDLNTAKTVAGKVHATWNQWNNLYNSIRSYYGPQGNGAETLNWAINWEWNANNVKREEIDQVMKKRQACSQSTNSSTSIDDTAIGSSISLITQPGTSSLPSSPSLTSSQVVSNSLAPVSTTAAIPTASSPAFNCTTNPNPVDPDYPCHCSDGLDYCDSSGPCESITSQPATENCCLDCE